MHIVSVYVIVLDRVHNICAGYLKSNREGKFFNKLMTICAHLSVDARTGNVSRSQTAMLNIAVCDQSNLNYLSWR